MSALNSRIGFEDEISVSKGLSELELNASNNIPQSNNRSEGTDLKKTIRDSESESVSNY